MMSPSFDQAQLLRRDIEEAFARLNAADDEFSVAMDILVEAIDRNTELGGDKAAYLRLLIMQVMTWSTPINVAGGRQ